MLSASTARYRHGSALLLTCVLKEADQGYITMYMSNWIVVKSRIDNQKHYVKMRGRVKRSIGSVFFFFFFLLLFFCADNVWNDLCIQLRLITYPSDSPLPIHLFSLSPSLLLWSSCSFFSFSFFFLTPSVRKQNEQEGHKINAVQPTTCLFPSNFGVSFDIK